MMIYFFKCSFKESITTFDNKTLEFSRKCKKNTLNNLYILKNKTFFIKVHGYHGIIISSCATILFVCKFRLRV